MKSILHLSLVALLIAIFGNQISPIQAHVVLTRDDRSQSLVLTGDDGNKGGDQVVISGQNMNGNGGSTNMIMQDAANREGDVVMNGNNMIVPGEDGHIVLADGRSNRAREDVGPMTQNFMPFWMPYMNSPYNYRMFPFFGAQFG